MINIWLCNDDSSWLMMLCSKEKESNFSNIIKPFQWTNAQTQCWGAFNTLATTTENILYVEERDEYLIIYFKMARKLKSEIIDILAK